MASGNNPPKICIIGAGFSGLCAGIQLQKQLNIDSFTIYDENHDVGGTWLMNTYPGCACDIPSHLYSYSFEPNPNWSETFSPQQEICEYLRNVAEKHELYPKIKFNHKISKIEFQDKVDKWYVSITDTKSRHEDTHVFDIVINGVGPLRIPNSPPQFDAFAGEKMHSARWDSSIELENKVVAIVGSGASAIQIIPEIVDKVKRLIVYQRKPSWVIPRLQVTFPDFVKWAFAYVPGLQWSVRGLFFWVLEGLHPAFKVDTWQEKLLYGCAKWNLNRQIKDPKVQEKLLPNYPIGCKRVGISSDYYPALAKPNVTIITSKIKDVTKDMIVTEDGTQEKPEVLILATGFKVQEFFAPLKIRAKGGDDLLQKWKREGPSAYYGTMCNATPNAFYLLGPNTVLGHNTVVFTIECQVNWMIQLVREMMRREARTVTVKKEVEKDYMEFLKAAFKPTVWGTSDCGSWYANDRGEVTSLWPETLVSFYNHMKTADFSKFDFV